MSPPCGLQDAEDAGFFSLYHDVLSRSRWSALGAGRLLLVQLVATFVPAGPVVIGLDDTIERHWGAKIAAQGVYRNPVRTSHGLFAKASGLRWLSAMLLGQCRGRGESGRCHF